MIAVSRALALVTIFVASSPAAAKGPHMTTLADLRHPHELSAKTQAIELFAIGQDVDTQRTIAPSQIEGFRDVAKRTLSSSAERSAFFRALEASVPEPGSSLAEVRIKAVLVDARGHRIAEIYAAYAPVGMLDDGTPVTFKHRNLLDFIERTLATKPATHTEE